MKKVLRSIHRACWASTWARRQRRPLPLLRARRRPPLPRAPPAPSSRSRRQWRGDMEEGRLEWWEQASDPIRCLVAATRARCRPPPRGLAAGRRRYEGLAVGRCRLQAPATATKLVIHVVWPSARMGIKNILGALQKVNRKTTEVLSINEYTAPWTFVIINCGHSCHYSMGQPATCFS